MISITCNHCQTVLSIDDAFAGGVCRCQHCGTIQTVPSRLRSTARAAAPDAPSTSGKTLYRKRARSDGPPVSDGTGLEDLAEVVASSGLSGSGLASDRLRKASPTSPTAPAKLASVPPRQILPIAAAVGLALIALIALIVWLIAGGNGRRPAGSENVKATETTVDSEPSLAPAPAATTASNFCGLSLADATSIIYVLDRGNGTRDLFDSLKEATFKSIESLGGDRKFQVIFWNNGSDDGYPAGLPAFARADNLVACRKALEDITAFGRSDPMSAMTKAMASHPSVIILATAKPLDADSTLAADLLELHKASPATRIDTFALGESDDALLKEIATHNGGKYQRLSSSALQSFAR